MANIKYYNIDAPATRKNSRSSKNNPLKVIDNQIETKCNHCGETCYDNPPNKENESIQCNNCDKWYHRACTAITPSMWEALSGNKNIHFICDDCVDKERRQSNDLKELKSIIENNQKENRQMMMNLEDKLLAKVDKVVDDKLKEHNEKNERKQAELEKMMKDMKETEITLDKNIEAQVKKYMDNKEEREQKKNNIIIHKLPESQENDKDQAEKDKSDIIKIIETTNPELKAELQDLVKDVKSIKRLGIKKAGSIRPRPIKITLPDEDMKKKIFKGCRNLKNSVFKNISIQEDLTKEEQEYNFQLRTQLKTRKENGEKVCIFRGKIIPEADHPANKK